MKVNKAGAITGEALVSAERLVARHTGRILEEIGRSWPPAHRRRPLLAGPDHNACQWCEYAAACHFEEGRGGDRRRFLPAVRARNSGRRLRKSKYELGAQIQPGAELFVASMAESLHSSDQKSSRNAAEEPFPRRVM